MFLSVNYAILEGGEEGKQFLEVRWDLLLTLPSGILGELQHHSHHGCSPGTGRSSRGVPKPTAAPHVPAALEGAQPPESGVNHHWGSVRDQPYSEQHGWSIELKKT